MDNRGLSSLRLKNIGPRPSAKTFLREGKECLSIILAGHSRSKNVGCGEKGGREFAKFGFIILSYRCSTVLLHSIVVRWQKSAKKASILLHCMTSDVRTKKAPGDDRRPADRTHMDTTEKSSCFYHPQVESPKTRKIFLFYGGKKALLHGQLKWPKWAAHKLCPPALSR